MIRLHYSPKIENYNIMKLKKNDSIIIVMMKEREKLEIEGELWPNSISGLHLCLLSLFQSIFSLFKTELKSPSSNLMILYLYSLKE